MFIHEKEDAASKAEELRKLLPVYVLTYVYSWDTNWLFMFKS